MVEGNAIIEGPVPDVSVRVVSISGDAFFFHGAETGLDWVALEHVGSLTLDYQNGIFLPEGTQIPFPYVAFPVLKQVDAPLVLLHSGRADLRALVGAHPYIVGGAVDALELADGGVLAGFTLTASPAAQPPLLLGGLPAGVAGDVSITNNAALPEAAAKAFVASLGSIAGTVVVCGNLDGESCPP